MLSLILKSRGCISSSNCEGGIDNNCGRVKRAFTKKPVPPKVFEIDIRFFYKLPIEYQRPS